MNVSVLNPLDFRNPRDFTFKYLTELSASQPQPLVEPIKTFLPLKTEGEKTQEIIERGYPYGYPGRPPLEIFPKEPPRAKPPEHLVQAVERISMVQLQDLLQEQRRPFREPDQLVDVYV